jgi:cytochrome P450
MKAAVDAIQVLAMRDFAGARPSPLWWNRMFDRQAYGAIKLLDDFVWRLIRERRASGEDRGDLLSMLLLAVDDEGDGSGMSDRQARDEIMTLLLAGHESTAVTLTWTVYLLAKHPDLQEELAAQARQTLGGRPPLVSDLAKLSLLEQTLKESMRLYPAVYFLSREAHEPLELGGYALPRGAQIHISPYLTHHDERWWPNPEQFDPERFTPANEAQIPPLAYFPFGAGPRGCIGKSFALMEAQLILASLLDRYRLELAPAQGEPALETQVSLHPQGGLKIVASRRAT